MFKGVIPDMLQVCVVVKDLDESMKRYTSTLGVGPFTVYEVDTREVTGVTHSGKIPDYKVRVAMAKMGSAVLELFECLRGESIWKEFLDRHGEGVHHIGFFVSDYAVALKDLTDKGFRVTVDGPIVGKEREGRFTYLETQKELGTTYELLDFPEELIALWK